MKLPQHPYIQEAYAQLLLEDRMVFEHAYALRSKGVGATYLAWMLGSHYIYLGRQKTQFAYWFTVGGLLLWALVDLFRIPGMVNGFNTMVALNALKPFERHPEPASEDLDDDLEFAEMLEPARIEPTPIESKWITPTQSESAQLKPVPTNHAVIELVFQ